MKKCTRCGETSDNFAKRVRSNDGLQSRCRRCVREINAAYYKATPEKNEARRASKKRMTDESHSYIVGYLSEHPCVDCGEPDIVVLEFDHVRGIKAGNVSEMVRSGLSLRRIKEEIEKCDVRCANDHRRVTAQRAGYYRSLAPDPQLVVEQAFTLPSETM